VIYIELLPLDSCRTTGPTPAARTILPDSPSHIEQLFAISPATWPCAR